MQEDTFFSFSRKELLVGTSIRMLYKREQSYYTLKSLDLSFKFVFTTHVCLRENLYGPIFLRHARFES